MSAGIYFHRGCTVRFDKSQFIFVYSAGLYSGVFYAILSSPIRTAFLPFCHSCPSGFSFSVAPIRNIYPTMNVTWQIQIHQCSVFILLNAAQRRKSVYQMFYQKPLNNRKVRFNGHVKVYNKKASLLLTFDNKYNTIISDANNCSIQEKEN